MTDNEFDAFAECLNGIAAALDYDLSPARIAIYWTAMRDAWSLPEVRAAAGKFIQESRFFPKVAEFNELRRKASVPCIGEIWPKVHRWIQGYDGPPDDPVAVKAVEAMGGRRALGFRSVDDLHWTAKEFEERYAELADATQAREALPMLAHEESVRISRTTSGPRFLAAAPPPEALTEAPWSTPVTHRLREPQAAVTNSKAEADAKTARIERALYLHRMYPGLGVGDIARMFQLTPDVLQSAITGRGAS